VKLKKTITETFNFLLEAYEKDVESIARVSGTRGFQQKQCMGKVTKEQADWSKCGGMGIITKSTRTLFIRTQLYFYLLTISAPLNDLRCY